MRFGYSGDDMIDDVKRTNKRSKNKLKNIYESWYQRRQQTFRLFVNK